MTGPYPTAARQHEAGKLGMLVFLASELMLFGALFGAALVLQLRYPAAVAAASAKLDMWRGAANTAILLTASLLVAVGVERSARRARDAAAPFLGGAGLGLLFLAVKASEYASEYREGLMPGTARAAFAGGPERLFFDFYFIATGLHGLHVGIGIALLAVVGLRQRSARPAGPGTAANVGLYWHLVDMIWLFLYPTLYLARA